MEARYLDGHSALFAAELRGWDELRTSLDELAAFADRLGTRGGWAVVQEVEDPTAAESEIAQFSADLDEPAKVVALEKLGGGDQAFALATRWLRTKFKPDVEEAP